MGRILVQSLFIRNFLGIKELKIHFNKPETVMLLLYRSHDEEDGKKQSPISMALQLMCSLKYSSIESLATLDGIIDAEIRLRFVKELERKSNVIGESDASSEFEDNDQPCTSKQAMERERLRKLSRQKGEMGRKTVEDHVNAIRKFRHHPEHIFFQSNGGSLNKVLAASFQAKYFTTFDYLINPVNNNSSDFDCKWIEYIKSDIDRLFQSERQNPFDVFINLYIKNYYKSDNMIPILNNTCIIGSTSLKLRQKQSLMILLNTLRKVFEYITNDEYTLWYYLTLNDGSKQQLSEITLEDIDFAKLETFIQLKKNCHNAYMAWKHCTHAIQDLIYIAFQIALAYTYKHNIVFLTISKNLVSEMTFKATAAAYILATEQEDMDLISSNYVNRIIDACNKLQIATALDIPGTLVINPKNGSILKLQETEKHKWNLICAIQSSDNCD